MRPLTGPDHSKVARLGFRVRARRLPKLVTLTDFDPQGVRFEASSPSELHRVLARGYEREYLGRLVTSLRRDDVLYDIGANIGLVALNAARRCRTVAFEPDPDICDRLRRNRELNPSAPFKIVQVAIGDRDGTVRLFTDGLDGGSPSLVQQRAERGTVIVQARTLDSIVAGDLPPPTVVKLDIEGAEILALRGATRLLSGPAAPRLLFIEVHDSFLPGFGSSPGEVRDILQRAGYHNALYDAKRSEQRHLILGRSSSVSTITGIPQFDHEDPPPGLGWLRAARSCWGRARWPRMR